MPTTQSFSFPEKSAFAILIVDDEHINRILLSGILEQAGYHTRDVDNGEEALAIVAQGKTDLVLLDIMMPRMDGYEVCRRIKADPRTAHIPVIFVTALTDTENLVKGFAAGAEDYLAKPIKEEEVMARVATQLKLKAAVDKIKQYNETLEQVVAESAKELVRAERQAAFGQFIQGIVHNLKGPLTSIRGSSQTCQAILRGVEEEIAQLLRNPDHPTDKLSTLMQGAGTALQLVDTASGRLTGMINSLMIKSSTDRSRSMERLDLNEIVREELSFLDADLYFKHHVTKKLELSAEPIPVMAVAPELSQVFNNLLRNAMDAMRDRPDPTVTITTAKNSQYGWLTVTDNGVGIPAENINKIFDPFFTTKQKTGDRDTGSMGTGLGLYMCMRSLKALEGDITVDSEAGEGATFRVKIPLAGANRPG